MTDDFLQKISKFFDELFLKTKLLVASAALVLSWQSLLVSRDYNFLNPVLLCIFSGTLFCYTLPYFFIRFPFSIIDFQRKIKRNRTVFFLFSASGIGLLTSVNFLNLEERIILFIIAALSVCYVMPVNISGKILSGLRNIPVFKNIVLASVWTLATAVLPLIDNLTIISPADLFFIAAKRFFFIFSLTIAFDIRDVVKDSSNNLKTIPNLIGINNSKIIAILSLLIFMVITLLHRYQMHISYSLLTDFSFPLLLSAVLTGFLILFINSTRKESFYSWLMDGSMIYQFVLVYSFILIG